MPSKKVLNVKRDLKRNLQTADNPLDLLTDFAYENQRLRNEIEKLKNKL